MNPKVISLLICLLVFAAFCTWAVRTATPENTGIDQDELNAIKGRK